MPDNQHLFLGRAQWPRLFVVVVFVAHRQIFHGPQPGRVLALHKRLAPLAHDMLREQKRRHHHHQHQHRRGRRPIAGKPRRPHSRRGRVGQLGNPRTPPVPHLARPACFRQGSSPCANSAVSLVGLLLLNHQSLWRRRAACSTAFEAVAYNERTRAGEACVRRRVTLVLRWASQSGKGCGLNEHQSQH